MGLLLLGVVGLAILSGSARKKSDETLLVNPSAQAGVGATPFATPPGGSLGSRQIAPARASATLQRHEAVKTDSGYQPPMIGPLATGYVSAESGWIQPGEFGPMNQEQSLFVGQLDSYTIYGGY